MKLRHRLALLVGSIVAVTIVVTGALTWWVASPSLIGAVDDLLGDQVDTFERVVADEVDRLAEIEATQSDPITQTAFRAQLTRPDGTVIGDTDLLLDPADLEAARTDDGDRFRTVEIDGESYRVLTREIDQGVVQLATSVESIESGLSDLRGTIRLTALLGIAIAAAAAWFLARRFTRPIVAVTDAAAQLSQRQGLPEPIVTDRTDEIGQLADSFNELVSALDLSQQQQSRLVADAGHELRTPLTSLRMKVEFLQSEPDLPIEQRTKIVDGAAVELEALGALVTELVDLAASGNAAEPRQELDLSELVEEVAARARLTTNRTITTSTDGTVVTARPNMVRRALSNLIGNAHKYSPVGAPIEIVQFRGGIEVRDHGSGFDDADREHAFDRFYRSATVQHVPGSGIGLAIVKQVADTHDGAVWIGTAADGGAVVGFSLGPVARRTSDHN